MITGCGHHTIAKHHIQTTVITECGHHTIAKHHIQTTVITECGHHTIAKSSHTNNSDNSVWTSYYS